MSILGNVRVSWAFRDFESPKEGERMEKELKEIAAKKRATKKAGK
jgi:hypothetical protein